jgi:hypothetical protein
MHFKLGVMEALDAGTCGHMISLAHDITRTHRSLARPPISRKTRTQIWWGRSKTIQRVSTLNIIIFLRENGQADAGF